MQDHIIPIPVLPLYWHNVQLAIDVLAVRLQDWKKAKNKPCIVAIGRGGLVPATMLSYQLDIPIVHVVFAKTYKGQENMGTRMTELAAIPQKMIKDCIFVDDILDTGSTFTAVKQRYPDAKFVVPFAKETGLNCHKLDLIVEPSLIFTDSSWLTFPWEESETA